MKTADDIHKEAELERKQEMKKKIVKDASDIVKGVIHETDKIVESKNKKNIAKNNALKIKFPWIYRLKKFMKGILILLFLLMFINLILFNIWLLKYFIESIF